MRESDVRRARPARRRSSASFGAKAYRRPVSTDEITRSRGALPRRRGQPGTYNDGIDLVTRGLLQSAGFLYVTELGDAPPAAPFTLTPTSWRARSRTWSPAARPTRRCSTARTAGGLATRRRARGAGAPPAGHAGRHATAWCASCASGWASTASSRPPRTPPSIRRFTPAARRVDGHRERRTSSTRWCRNSTGTVGELLRANWSIVDSTLAADLRRHLGWRDRSTRRCRSRLGILNQARVPVGLRARTARRRPVLRGVAVMRRVACMNAADPGVAEHRRRAAGAGSDEVDARSLRRSTPPTPAAPPVTTDRLDRLRVRAVRRHGGTHGADQGRHAPGHTSGEPTVTRTRPQHDHHRRGLPATSTAPTPTATRWRRRWRSSPQVRECLARQIFRASAGRSDDTVARPREQRSSTSGSSCRPTSRGSSSRCWSPTSAARSSTNGARREEAANAQTRRSFLRAVGAGAAALPFYRLLEDSVAQAAGETLPLRF